MSAEMKNQTEVPTISIHDPDFKNLVTIPLSAVLHLPPAHLEISRLVLCRKFDPKDPSSCPVGNACKFVHADLEAAGVETQSIHVNYAWRSLAEVTHKRLPAGEMIEVLAPNNRAPAQLVPSEFVLATKGAMARRDARKPMSHCAHYYFNRMCNRGDRCLFIHAVFVDPTASEFQRAPPRAGAGYANSSSLAPSPAPIHTPAPSVSVVPKRSLHQFPPTVKKSPSDFSMDSNSSCDISSNDSHSDDVEEDERVMAAPSAFYPTHYRRNPYSLLQVTISC